MNKLPCITNKCLKYPICKYKTVIDCDELIRYYTKYIKRRNPNNFLYPEIFKHLQKALPNLRDIKGTLNEQKRKEDIEIWISL